MSDRDPVTPAQAGFVIQSPDGTCLEWSEGVRIGPAGSVERRSAGPRFCRQPRLFAKASEAMEVLAKCVASGYMTKAIVRCEVRWLEVARG